MTMVKTLVALATERMLLKTSGPTFLRGIEFMYAAGLAPDRLSVMMTSSHKYVLQFHSKCDIRPFAANYPNFGRVLRGIVHVREWRIKSIEFVNVAFYMRDVDNLERAIEKLGVELVLLRNCTYPGVNRGDEAVKFLSALNRKKQAVVCEYGDDRLKHRIGRRASGHRARRASRNGGGGGQEVVAPPAPPPEIFMAGMQEAVLEIAPPPVPQAPVPMEVIPENPGNPAVELRRPIPLNMEQARRIVPQMIPGNIPPVPEPVPEAPREAPSRADLTRRAMAMAREGLGRVAVGNHVYEFRPVDAPNIEQLPHVNNLQHLLHVLNDNPSEVRVILFPRDGNPVNLANNPEVLQRLQGAMDPQDPAPRAQLDAQVAPEPYRPQQQRQQYQQRAQEREIFAFDQAANHDLPYGGPVYQRAMPPPMFGVAVNEPQVQRGGDDSNDSTDREDPMFDPEQQRIEVLRDLVADPEALPNFAPVEAQGVDLEMLEEEGDEEEEDEEEASEDVMDEGNVIEPNFIIADQPLIE